MRPGEFDKLIADAKAQQARAIAASYDQDYKLIVTTMASKGFTVEDGWKFERPPDANPPVVMYHEEAHNSLYLQVIENQVRAHTPNDWHQGFDGAVVDRLPPEAIYAMTL